MKKGSAKTSAFMKAESKEKEPKKHMAMEKKMMSSKKK